ncbi:hypothetical protein HYW20_07340 [Candidatus Woesearchaeota archaeon]|nr:hypothetical protein [Candidatus Woesearchaeota archaeon]
MGATNSRFFFVLLSVGAAIGLGSIWLYPFFSFKITGLFFIPYSIALVLLGMPLLMLEFSIGRYFNKNVVDLFASIRKWFSGIGWLMIFNVFIVMSFYAVVLSWHIIYFFVSFGLQWKNGAEAYFFNNVLQASEGFKGFLQFSLPVFIALMMAWIGIFFFIRKGYGSIKKAFLATIPIFAFLVILFFVYSLTLDNALFGVYSFLKPRFNQLLKLDIWFDSFSLAVLYLGLSFGIMHALGGKSEGNFIVGNSLIVVILKVLVSIAFSFILFGILGFLSMEKGIDLDKLVFSDFGSEFTILAQAFPLFYRPALLSLLFFIFLSLFFLLGAASLASSMSHVIVHKFKTKHVNAAIIVTGFGFLFGLLFIIKPGYYIMDIVSHFVYYNIVLCILLEVIAVGWFFEIERIAEYINQYSILKIGGIWAFIVKYFAPLILFALLFLQIKSDFAAPYKGYPLWALLVFGVGTVVVPLIVAFLMPQKILDRKK